MREERFLRSLVAHVQHRCFEPFVSLICDSIKYDSAPVVSRVRSTGCDGLPVWYICAMPCTNWLKLLEFSVGT